MLFLDLDGTVLDVRRRHYATYMALLRQPDLRGHPIPEREYWGLRREGKPIDVILKRSRLFPTKYQQFCERFEQRVETPEMLALDKIREGTETFLSKVFTKTPIVLITQRKDAEALKNQIASLRLARFFVTVLAGAPKRGRRVDKDARWRHKAQLVRNRYKLPPTESLYIGDTETDVKASRALGYDVFLVEGGNRTKELQMKADPDRIVVDLPASLKYVLEGGRWQR